MQVRHWTLGALHQALTGESGRSSRWQGHHFSAMTSWDGWDSVPRSLGVHTHNIPQSAHRLWSWSLVIDGLFMIIYGSEIQVEKVSYFLGVGWPLGFLYSQLCWHKETLKKPLTLCSDLSSSYCLPYQTHGMSISNHRHRTHRHRTLYILYEVSTRRTREGFKRSISPSSYFPIFPLRVC